MRYRKMHYGPNGEQRVFTDAFDVPKDWKDHPFEEGHTPPPEPPEGTPMDLGPPPEIEPGEPTFPEEAAAFDHDHDGHVGGSEKGEESTVKKGQRKRRKRKA